MDNMGRRALLLYGCMTQSAAMAPGLMSPHALHRKVLRLIQGLHSTRITAEAAMVYAVQFMRLARKLEVVCRPPLICTLGGALHCSQEASLYWVTLKLLTSSED